MGKSKTVSNVAAGAAVAICLSTAQVAQADGNPFQMQILPKGGAAGQKLAYGMCGGMMDGMMMGGEMPRGVDPAQLPEPQSAGAQEVVAGALDYHAEHAGDDVRYAGARYDGLLHGWAYGERPDDVG